MDPWGIEGSRALIAGGTGGIGSAIVGALNGAGCRVAVLGRSASEEEAARLAGGGPAVHAVAADLADRAALRAGFDVAVDALGGLDILVAAQGVARPSPALEGDLAAWDATLEVNLTSVFELCSLAARRMLPTGGRIVTIASMLSFFGGAGVAAYAASKGGVAQLTKALATEWAPLGVNVNAIAPGYVRTGANRHIWQDDPARLRQITERIPAGRWGDPAEIADPVLFLCSPASRYLHGAVIPVDGGYLAR